jgi:DNA-binding transcriptional LysR family regulator
MFDWNDLRYFLAVQRAGTLAAAAGEVGSNATTVGRRITALEEQVGARLFDRTTDGWFLTASGQDLLPHAERVEREAAAVERSVVGADQRTAGLLRLATTEMLATRFLAQHLPRFHERHPEITLVINCSLRALSLGRREADVVLRLTRPREPDVVARELMQIELSLYAARCYVERAGVPARPDVSLAGHRVILFADSPAFALENQWLDGRLDGATTVLRSDSVSSIYAAAVAGAGIALLPSKIADADASLVRIGATTAPEPRTVWQGVHKDLAKNARVRAVSAFLREAVVPIAR